MVKPRRERRSVAEDDELAPRATPLDLGPGLYRVRTSWPMRRDADVRVDASGTVFDLTCVSGCCTIPRSYVLEVLAPVAADDAVPGGGH
jgi:hypothetical protein